MRRIAVIPVALLLSAGCTTHDDSVSPVPKVRVIERVRVVERLVPVETIKTVEIEKVVEKIVVKTRTCSTVRRIELSSVCGKPVTRCEQISTCAEAIYRLQVCGHAQHDLGKPNGVPCERDLCKGEKLMEARAQPFLPPMATDVTTCTEPA